MPPRRLSFALSRTRLAADHQRLERALGRSVALAPVDTAALDPAALGLARRFWEARTVMEHRSATLFSDLLLQLRDVGVAPDVEAMVLRCALDELGHAGLCARFVTALGGDPEQPCEETARRLPLHGRISPRARLLRNLVYTSALSETLAAAILAASRDQAQVPAARQVLEALLADEVVHGRFGWDVLDHLAPLTDDDRRDLERYLRMAFDNWERAALGEALETPRRPLPADALALGVLPAEAGRELFRGVVAEAVLPGLEARGVAATAAWHARGPEL